MLNKNKEKPKQRQCIETGKFGCKMNKLEMQTEEKKAKIKYEKHKKKVIAS